MLRQLRQNLANTEAEKDSLGMPPKSIRRPGFEIIVQQGEKYEAEKLEDLKDCYGAEEVFGTAVPSKDPDEPPEWKGVPIWDGLDSGKRLLFQPEFEVTESFKTAHGLDRYVTEYGLTFAELRLDILRIYPPGTYGNMIDESGNVMPVPEDDHRWQIRIADIKLSAEPSHGSFAEVAYYMMTLADGSKTTSWTIGTWSWQTAPSGRQPQRLRHPQADVEMRDARDPADHGPARRRP
jgi:hypothetical protein